MLFNIVLITIAGFLGVVHSQVPEPLQNTGIYTLYNRGDQGYLTSIGETKLVSTDVWRDTGSQKWRAVKGYITTAYMFKPTSEENSSIYVNKHTVMKGLSGFGLSSTQYWAIYKADRGYYNIKNLDSNECLESVGLGKGIFAAPCRNSPLQQWALHLM